MANTRQMHIRRVDSQLGQFGLTAVLRGISLDGGNAEKSTPVTAVLQLKTGSPNLGYVETISIAVIFD